MASGTTFTTRAKVLATSGEGVNGYIVGDATGVFGYVYAIPTADVVVGSYIEMTGATTFHSSIFELVPTTVTKLETAGPTLTNTATAWTPTEYDAYDGKSVQYVSLTGAEVASNGAHHNFTIDGSSNKGSVSNAIVDGFYNFTGFAYGIASGYRSFVLESSAEAVRPAATALAISAAGNATTLGKGETFQLSAEATAPFGAVLPTDLTWTSSDAADDSIIAADKVTVDSTGLVTAPATAAVHVVTVTATSASLLLTSTYQLTISEVSASIYSTGFEASESFKASTTYNNSALAKFGPSDKQWGTLCGSVSTTGPLADSQSFLMRSYKSVTTAVPTLTMQFDMANVLSFSFLYKNDVADNSFELDYSLDGGSSWTKASDITNSLTATTGKFNFATSQTSVRFRFLNVTTSATDKKGWQIDSILAESIAQ
jgi:hypothetical protein